MPDLIPVYVFDEHNEAYYFWHKAKYDGYLSQATDIYHVDAHSDMAQLDQLKSSLYWNPAVDGSYLQHYRKIACKEMNIADFIIPGVLNKLIRNIYFIYPHWRKYKLSRKRKNVATAFGEGRILKHDIKMTDAERSKMLFAYPDFIEYNYIRTEVAGMPKSRKIILDIDLDYFACTDSITNHMRYELAITREQYEDKAAFLAENPNLQYSGLQISFRKKGQRYFASVGFDKQRDLDYFPSQEEIQREIKALVNTLVQKRITPVAVTICRSCISGYCPPGYFSFIEEQLLKELRQAFPSASVLT